jgi:excisionase family DNA binding protein
MSEIAHEAHGDLERLKKRLLTVKGLADKLNVSEKMIYSYVSQNRLPYMKIESNFRFDPSAISEWLKVKLSARRCEASWNSHNPRNVARYEAHPQRLRGASLRHNPTI